MNKAFLPFSVKESLDIIDGLRNKIKQKYAENKGGNLIYFDMNELKCLDYIISFFKTHYVIDNNDDINKYFKGK